MRRDIVNYISSSRFEPAGARESCLLLAYCCCIAFLRRREYFARLDSSPFLRWVLVRRAQKHCNWSESVNVRQACCFGPPSFVSALCEASRKILVDFEESLCLHFTPLRICSFYLLLRSTKIQNNRVFVVSACCSVHRNLLYLLFSPQWGDVHHSTVFSVLRTSIISHRYFTQEKFAEQPPQTGYNHYTHLNYNIHSYKSHFTSEQTI